MPLYRYSCESCESTFEHLESAAAVATAVACPNCASEAVSRTFGLPAKPKPGRDLPAATNCRGDGPPCGASFCGRSPR